MAVRPATGNRLTVVKAAEENDFGLSSAWWPVAFGDDIRDKPIAARLGRQRIALYRDGEGVVRAVSDSCAHRRLPLSMGRVTPEGYLQCGYHGWCYDGRTGQCVVIPQYRPDEKPALSLRVAAFITAERPIGSSADLIPTEGDAPDHDVRIPTFETALADGFVHIWVDSPNGSQPLSARDDMPHAKTADGGGVVVRGQAEVRSHHEAIADTIHFNPGKALGIGLLVGAGEDAVAPRISAHDGFLQAERVRTTLGLARPSSFDPVIRHMTTSRIVTRVDNGLTVVTTQRGIGGLSARVTVALTPVSDYRTVVHWRVELPDGGLSHIATPLLTLIRKGSKQLARRIERATDAMDEVIDPGVARLRELRAGLRHQPSKSRP